jgi:hypothetical protein
MSVDADLPNVAQVLAGILAKVGEAERPLLIALAERLAAERYRGWAADARNAPHAAALRECAGREEEIARRIESLYDDAAARQQGLLTAHPDLAEINRTLFEGRPTAQQLAIQAGGERLGAATWRSLARHEGDPRRRDVIASCAPLEEASAEVLEAILAGGSSR